MSELQRIFMRRDGMTAVEAQERIKEMRQQVLDGEDPEEVLNDEGLEPDYIFEILTF